MIKPYQIVNRNILQYRELYPLEINNAVAIQAKYRNAKAYQLTSFILQLPNHPLWPRHEKRWQTRTDPLWWSTACNKEFSMKSVVRSWQARRIRAAFVESLRKKGWNACGRPLPGPEQKTPLYGTLQMTTHKGSSPTVGAEQIAKETDAIVEEIIKRQGANPYSQTSKTKGKSWKSGQ